MQCLPEPTPDGKCVTCGKPAVTTDKRFCRKCLRAFIASQNYIPPTPHRNSHTPPIELQETDNSRDDIIRAIENCCDGDMEIPE